MRKLLPIVRALASRSPPHGFVFPIFDRKSMKTKIESWPRLATSLLFDSSGHVALPGTSWQPCVPILWVRSTGYQLPYDAEGCLRRDGT
jgi:hypothetical protein